MLGDLGRDEDFLYRDRVLLDPVLRRGVVKVGRPCVVTQQVCQDRMTQRAKTNSRGHVHHRHACARVIRIHARSSSRWQV